MTCRYNATPAAQGLVEARDARAAKPHQALPAHAIPCTCGGQQHNAFIDTLRHVLRLRRAARARLRQHGLGAAYQFLGDALGAKPECSPAVCVGATNRCLR